jgi:hypothetical protein
MVHPSDGDAW